MKGYIQDQSIVLIEAIPSRFSNGDEVEIVIVGKPTSSTNLNLGNDYQALVKQWDAIPDAIAAQLKAEFAVEDQAFADTTSFHYAGLMEEADE
jgi:hypothetical protein